MPDNIAVTPGTGATVSTEEITTLNGGAVSAQHAQRVIQAIRTADGVASDVTTSNPLPVDAGTVQATLEPGEEHVGEVGGRGVSISPTITIDTAAYTAGDAVGGKLTLSNALRITNGSAVLQDILVTDNANQKAALTVLIFNANPAATSANNAAFAFGSGDLARIAAKVNIAASDYETINSKAVAHKQNLGIVIKGADGTAHLYAFIVTTGTPTYTASSDLTIRAKFLQD